MHGEATSDRIRISDVARLCNVSVSTLREWQRQGLLDLAATQAGYRIFNEDDLQRMLNIRRMRVEQHPALPYEDRG